MRSHYNGHYIWKFDFKFRALSPNSSLYNSNYPFNQQKSVCPSLAVSCCRAFVFPFFFLFVHFVSVIHWIRVSCTKIGIRNFVIRFIFFSLSYSGVLFMARWCACVSWLLLLFISSVYKYGFCLCSARVRARIAYFILIVLYLVDF